MWWSGLQGNNSTCWVLRQLSATFPTTHKQIEPFCCWFLGGWVCVHSRTLWVSPANSPVRLGVSPATASTLTGLFSQRFWGFISLGWKPGLWGLSCSPVVPPGLSACKCGATHYASHHLARSTSCHFAASPLHPSPPLLLVWMNVSSLTPWLSDFHTVWFSVSSGCFLFLNLLLSFFWLCKEARCIYLHLHLGWKPWIMVF